MNKKSAIIKKVQARVRLAEENKSFVGQIREHIKNMKKEISSVEDRLLPDIEKLYNNIIEIAEEKYEEGQDYYGEDYISQRADRKLRSKIFQAIEDYSWDIWDVDDDLKKLKNNLQKVYKEIQEE